MAEVPSGDRFRRVVQALGRSLLWFLGIMGWPFRRLGEWYLVRLKTHRVSTILWTPLAVFVLVFVLNLLRVEIQPLVVWAWVHALFVICFLVPIFIGAYYLVFHVAKHRKILGRLVCYVGAILLLFGTWDYGLAVHDYLALWWRYQTLAVVHLDRLPMSANERVQPWYGVKTAAHDSLGTTLVASDPAIVRDPDGSWHFTVAFEPSYLLARGVLFFVPAKIAEVHSVPATAGRITFGQKSRIPVSFDVGDNLLLSHHIQSCMIRSFGIWRYFNYEPSTAVYLKQDDGQIVQVVPLIRWTGILFPRPEFGGVEVIPQHEEGFWRNISLWLGGCGGYWVRPEDIGKYSFLAGQNLVPDKVSRYIALSFRFHNGFLAPLPGYHSADIRIPDLPGDMRDEPFVGYFKMPIEPNGKVYHYFALEPFDDTKHGLTFSVWVPGDNIGSVFVYDHDARHDGLYGPTGIEAAVMGSSKWFDWTKNRPVENRPFIRHICGQDRVMWITTIVTLDQKGGFTGGSAPYVTITDGEDRQVFLVSSKTSDTWAAEVEHQMCGAH